MRGDRDESVYADVVGAGSVTVGALESSTRVRKATWQNFPYKLRFAHLQIVRHDKTGPEDGRDVAGTDLAIPNEFRAEPKTLDEH